MARRIPKTIARKVRREMLIEQVDALERALVAAKAMRLNGDAPALVRLTEAYASVHVQAELTLAFLRTYLEVG